MSLKDLKWRYRELRGALEVAYQTPDWDTEQIDRLADEIHSVELALDASRAGGDRARDALAEPRQAE